MDPRNLSNAQKREFTDKYDKNQIKAQKANQRLFGDPLSLYLELLVATSDKNVLAVHSLFAGAHYMTNPRMERILAKNFLIGKPYNPNYEYLIIPVIIYHKAKMTSTEIENSIGHWITAIFIRQTNNVLYLDPYGNEINNIRNIPSYVLTIIYNAINTVGPQITDIRPGYFPCLHNNQPGRNTVDCGYFCLFFCFRFLSFLNIHLIFDQNFNLFEFKNSVIATLKILVDIDEAPVNTVNNDDIQILSPPKAKKSGIDISHLPIAYQPKPLAKKTLSKNPKLPMPKPAPKVLISSRKGRPPKTYSPRKSDSENSATDSEPMKLKSEQDCITLDSSSEEESTPLKKSKIADTPTAPFDALSLTTPKNEKSNVNNSATPKRPNLRKSVVGDKRPKAELAEKSNDAKIDNSNTVTPMEIDRQILTPKRVGATKIVNTVPVTPKSNFNDSVISESNGATPVTTENEADDEISFIEYRTNEKVSGFDALALDDGSYRVIKNRYSADPRQIMTVETNGQKTIIHKMNISPNKKPKNETVIKVNEEVKKTGAKIEIEKIIPPKKGKRGSQIVLKKTEETDLNLSDSSVKNITPNKSRFTKGVQHKKVQRNSGRFSQKDTTKNSKTDVENTVVDETTQIVLFDSLTKSQKLMPPPNLFKVYEKTTGEKLKKVKSPKSKNKSDKEVEMEIDTTKNEQSLESDSSAVSLNAQLKKGRGRPPKKTVAKKQDTVTESEMENSDTSAVSLNAQPKKGRGRPPKKTVAKKQDTVTESEMENSDTSAVSLNAQPKKGRGRPPKKGVTTEQVTVTESEMETETSDAENKPKNKAGRPIKKKKGGRPKIIKEPSKWPKTTSYHLTNPRCHFDGFKHKEGCAAYSVNHEVTYKDHGDFKNPCRHCKAMLNDYEKNTPSAANKCCNNGDLVTAELLKTQEILDNPPEFMDHCTDFERDENKCFIKNSIKYNKDLSFGTIRTTSKLPPLPGHGPPVVRMNGDYEHYASGFFSPKGQKPAFGQLYCIDFNAAEDIIGEKAKQSKLSVAIAKALLKMIKENHVFAPLMETASEMFEKASTEAEQQNREMPQFRCIIVDLRDADFKATDQHIHPHRAEKPRDELVGMIWTNDNGEPPEFKGIWLNGTDGETSFVPYYSPNVDPLCYPLLFPYGTQIYHNGILLNKTEKEASEQKIKVKNIMEDDTDVSEAEVERHINGDDDDDNVDEDILEEDVSKKRKKIKGRRYASRKQVTRFFLYPRQKRGFQNRDPHWLWNKGPIADAWLIDMVCRAERSQLDVARKKVEKMKNRCATSNDLKKYVEKNYLNNKKLGTMFTIPSSFKGGRKYMQNAYADIMTIIDNTTLPSYFVTFTGNPTWPEITRNMRKGDTTRSDLKCRVFLTKAQEFLDDLFKRHIFGKVQAYHVVMEFQKRGMPHLHVLLIMEDEITVADVDNYISARLPEKPDDNDTSEGAEQQRLYYNMVMKHMLHICNANSACQVNGRCTKGYKKPFSTTTVIHTHKPPDYQRLKPKSALDENPTEIEKSTNLPSPKKEAVKFDDNDEFFAPMESVNEKMTENPQAEDKTSEAVVDDEWEELPFFDELRKDFDEDLTHVQYKRLQPVPDGVEVTKETEHLFGFSTTKKIKGRPEAFIDDSVVVPHNKFLLLKYDCHINVECTIGQTGSPKYTCKYVTKGGDVVCAKLQKVKINPTTGEEEIDFDEGERHLIARVMTGCEAWMRASNCWIIKQSHIVECLQIHLEGENTKVFYPGYEKNAAEKDDKSQLIAYFKLCQKDKEARKYTYREIPLYYRYKNGEWIKRKRNPNKFLIRTALENKQGGFFSLIGSGGTGKTFFYNFLITYCKAYGINPMISASTGIAATLLNGGQTAHSAFCIPKSLDEDSPIRIKAETKRGEQLQDADLIIVDECSMLHKHVLQYIDRTMQDMKDSKNLFGGAVVLIGGDWKQLTPVVPGGSNEDVIDASIKKWDNFDQCVTLELNQNMRVNPAELDFIEELKLIGNGDTVNYANYIKGTDFIKVDPDYILKNGSELINFCYEEEWLKQPEKFANELAGSAILSPRNSTVRTMNQQILNRLHGSLQKTFYSRNTPLGDQAINAIEHNINEYSVENMEKTETAGMPPHELCLKKGAIVMLIKNISVSTGLCNGTRMQVTDIFDDFIKCRVLSGSRSGNNDEIYLPRCKFEYGGTPSEPGIHFTRCQFPVKLAFSMTINKAQGQTLNRVGLYFRAGDCFSHGQLYTAMSRVRAKQSVKIVTNVEGTDTVKNVVFPQLLI